MGEEVFVRFGKPPAVLSVSFGSGAPSMTGEALSDVSLGWSAPLYFNQTAYLYQPFVVVARTGETFVVRTPFAASSFLARRSSSDSLGL